MKETEKNTYLIFKEEEKSSRALGKDFYEKLNAELSPIIELVKKDSQLQLCFRGNNSGHQAVMIYYKNQKILEVLSTGKISFDYNHARYCSPEIEKEYKKKLVEYGFTIKDKFNKKGEKDIKTVTRVGAKKPLTLQELEKIVDEILIPIFF